MPTTPPPPLQASAEKIAKLLMYIVFVDPQDEDILALVKQNAQHLMPDPDFVRQIKDYYK